MVSRKHLECLSFLTVMLSMISLNSAWSQTREEKATKAVDTISLNKLFKNKIIGLKVDESSALEAKSDSAYLHECEIIKLGDRFFIVGKTYIPDHPKYEAYKYLNDSMMGVAWETVTQFRAYTKDQYAEWLKTWANQDEPEKQ